MGQTRFKDAARANTTERSTRKTPKGILAAKRAAAAELLKHGQAYLERVADPNWDDLDGALDEIEAEPELPNDDEFAEPLDNDDLHDSDYADAERVDPEDAARTNSRTDKPWYLPDDPNGPYIFRISAGANGAPARCEHLPKAWMTDRNDVPAAADAKERLRTSLDKLAADLEARLPTFLNDPNAQSFAVDWAQTIGANAAMKKLACKVPWQANAFVDAVCPKFGSDRFSRVKDRLLLVWPSCQMPLAALVSEAFKQDVAKTLFAEYARRFGWDINAGTQGADRDKLIDAFNELDKSRRKSLIIGTMDGPKLRLVWERIEGVTWSGGADRR